MAVFPVARNSFSYPGWFVFRILRNKRNDMTKKARVGKIINKRSSIWNIPPQEPVSLPRTSAASSLEQQRRK
jgi:hypothetical protein